jgi:hypothetical protein
MFGLPRDTTPPQTLIEIRDALELEGVSCRVDADDDGEWLVIEDGATDASVTVEDGFATSMMLQVGDNVEASNKFLKSMEKLGWDFGDD